MGCDSQDGATPSYGTRGPSGKAPETRPSAEAMMLQTGTMYRFNTQELANPELGKRRAGEFLDLYDVTISNGHPVVRRKDWPGLGSALPSAPPEAPQCQSRCVNPQTDYQPPCGRAANADGIYCDQHVKNPVPVGAPPGVREAEGLRGYEREWLREIGAWAFAADYPHLRQMCADALLGKPVPPPDYARVGGAALASSESP